MHTGEKAHHVIAHCFEAWGAWGQPKELKTDNGPAYTSNTFVSFCKMMGVHLVHGIPYNPQGQGIIGWPMAWARSSVGVGERVCLCVSPGPPPAVVGT